VEDWDLKPGDVIERKELHRLYGGRPQGGIGPSKRSPNVLIFTDAASGEQHGYYDGWGDDGCFQYVGEGQRGDQRMLSGNASILRHREEGRALRLFQGARGQVRYLGEFGVDPDRPWYLDDAPETGGGPIRQVIVFRLRPLDTAPQPAPVAVLSPAGSDQVAEVPLEEQRTEHSFVDPSREPYEAERREAKLVLQYGAWLRSEGHSVARLRVVPKGERKPLFSDLWDKTTNTVIEAKGTGTREALRMAIGQLVDYTRFIPRGPNQAILLPAKPRDDLMSLAAAAGVEVIWRTPAGDFEHQAA
jgi:hypothetical protein